eukprot:6182140-Pleurochrysis_carterae.AAC.1
MAECGTKGAENEEGTEARRSGGWGGEEQNEGEWDSGAVEIHHTWGAESGRKARASLAPWMTENWTAFSPWMTGNLGPVANYAARSRRRRH